MLTAFLLSAISSMAADGYADKSVLASGKWVKIKVDESGMYQLSRSTLSGMGFSDISKVKIYGYGGAMISERMGDGYVDDLPQIPVYNDGSKIVFYAQGPVSWEDSGNSIVPVEHIRNPYSVSGYYFVTENDNENDNSSVIYTELNNHKFLFMGDAGVEVEEDLIEKYNLQDIDVLKVGHHGSKTSSSEEFINNINPKYSIISVGKNNRYGHPNKEVLENLKKSKIYRTDKEGSIMFKIKKNKLQIETCSP